MGFVKFWFHCLFIFSKGVVSSQFQNIVEIKTKQFIIIFVFLVNFNQCSSWYSLVQFCQFLFVFIENMGFKGGWNYFSRSAQKSKFFMDSKYSKVPNTCLLGTWEYEVLDLLSTIISSIDEYWFIRPGWSPNFSLPGPKLKSILKMLYFLEDLGS